MVEKKSYMSSSDQMALGIALRSEDYGWEERTAPKKKIILTNPEALRNCGLMSYVSLFRGTGHSEWEFLMGAWMIDAVGESLETGNDCDITIVFNTDFLARPQKTGDDYRRFTKEQVFTHLIKFFTVQEDSTNVLKVAMNVA